VTGTAVFLGEGVDRGMVLLPEAVGGKLLRAFDKRNGAVVAEIELPGGTSGAPITYMADGKQYIVVAVGWSDMESEWVALALP
jgi:quinoprotein glucose dehydrogenase